MCTSLAPLVILKRGDIVFSAFYFLHQTENSSKIILLLRLIVLLPNECCRQVSVGLGYHLYSAGLSSYQSCPTFFQFFYTHGLLGTMLRNQGVPLNEFKWGTRLWNHQDLRHLSLIFEEKSVKSLRSWFTDRARTMRDPE